MTSSGQEASREHYTLCHCGASRNKPFCDGSHNEINIKNEKLNVGSHDNAFNNYPMIIMKYDEITIPWLLRSLLGLIHVRSFASILRHLYVLS